MTLALLKATTVAILLAHLVSSVLFAGNGDAIATTRGIDSDFAASR
jgi:hypothetical protein